MKLKKIIACSTAILSVALFSLSVFAYTYEQTDSTTNSVKKWLKTPDNTYVEYDYGTSAWNDDAWLKAEVNASTNKYAYCYAKFGSNGKATAQGTTANNYHAVAEVSGIDKFNSGSYAEARNANSRTYLSIR